MKKLLSNSQSIYELANPTSNNYKFYINQLLVFSFCQQQYQF